MSITLHTAGSSQGDVICSFGHECGDIVGGIAISYVNYPFPVVVSFEDFEKAYLLAKADRETAYELRLQF
jgi:hypothetical protein